MENFIYEVPQHYVPMQTAVEKWGLISSYMGNSQGNHHLVVCGHYYAGGSGSDESDEV
jgi:hypothetical protein